MDKDQFSVIKDLIGNLQKSVDILTDDREHDVKKVNDVQEELQEVRIRLGAVEGQLDELRKGLSKQAEKVQDKVSEAVQPLVDSSDSLKESIDKKKFKILREPFKWRIWWSIWRGDKQ